MSNNDNNNREETTIMTKSNLKVNPSTMYRLRAGQGVIRTTGAVVVRDGMLAAESYEFIYQIDPGLDPTTWWPVKKRTSSEWEPVPTYPVNVLDIWTEIQIVPAAVKETEVS